MDSNTYQLQQQQHQPNSGLLRFRSAPSSLLANHAPPCGESEALGSRFAGYGGGGGTDSSSDNNAASPSFREFEDSANKGCESSKVLRGMNSQRGYGGGGGGGGGGVGLPPQYPRQGSGSGFALYGSLVGSMAVEENEADQKGFGASSSNLLLRQSSSPAGLFSNTISFQNGFANMKGVGNYGAVNGSNGSPSINGLKNQISFSSRTGSSLGMLSQISEIGSDEIGATSPDDDGRQGGGNSDDAPHYGPGFPYGSWNDSPQLSENFTGSKRGRNTNQKLFSDVQNAELGNQVQMLSHSLSLPKTSSEMVNMEKLLQFPDSVPCKIRAKRGCATHPRSIAERVRRTRISERMRKLQELVPNMDKQTNTADMLDLAVEYIKDLQKEFKGLSEKRANCKCIRM